MVEELYQIVVSKVDKDLGYETADFAYKVEFKQYPSQQDIFTAIEELQGDVARVEKRYKKIKA